MMETVTVLKQRQIRTEGRCRLPIRIAGITAGPSPVRPAAGSAAPQVKLVENTADYAILEVICGCGQSLFIQCQYSAPVSP
jgi:hypothetical protein